MKILYSKGLYYRWLLYTVNQKELSLEEAAAMIITDKVDMLELALDYFLACKASRYYDYE